MFNSILNFYYFLVNKNQQEIQKSSIKYNIIVCFWLLVLFYTILIILSFIKTFLIEKGILTPLKYNNIDSPLSLSILQIILLSVIIDPIIEETIFRLWLKYKSIYLSLSIATLVVFIINIFTEDRTYIHSDLNHNLLVVSLFILFFFTTYSITNKYKKKTTLFFNKNIRILFYASAIIFGYGHMMKFEITPSIIYLSPLVFGSFILFGLITGYIRLRFGFIYSISFHIITNFIPYIIGVFTR